MTETAEPDTFLDPHQRATIEAAMARIIPHRSDPRRAGGRSRRLPRPLPVGHRLHLCPARRQRFREARAGAASAGLAAAGRPRAQRVRRRDRGARQAGPRAPRRRPSSELDRGPSRTRSCAALERPEQADGARTTCHAMADPIEPALQQTSAEARPRLLRPARHAHPPGLSRRPDLRRQPRSGRLADHRLPRARRISPRCTPAATPPSSTSPTTATHRAWRSAHDHRRDQA